MKFANVDEILDFAISNEEKAFDFYMSLATKAKRPAMSEAFEEFAAEEEKHKTKLLAVKSGKKIEASIGGKTTDLKLSDYLVDIEPSPDMEYQDALIVAMKMEKAAFRLYSDLAANTDDTGLKDLFLSLAQEEAKHKLRFELEYDENVHQGLY